MQRNFYLSSMVRLQEHHIFLPRSKVLSRNEVKCQNAHGKALGQKPPGSFDEPDSKRFQRWLCHPNFKRFPADQTFLVAPGHLKRMHRQAPLSYSAKVKNINDTAPKNDFCTKALQKLWQLGGSSLERPRRLYR